MSDIVEDIAARLKSTQKILLIGHEDPDGDAVGALLGLRHALVRLGKEVVMASPSRPPSKYAFLPALSLITVHPPAGAYDLVVSVDCSDPQRLGGIPERLFGATPPPLINIDHHITNVLFGELNWVDPYATSTSEMVVCLVDALGVRLDREMALPLLTGIIADTRGFRTPNTTSDVLRMAGRLLDAGIELAEVMERTLNLHPFGTLCLWGKMLNTARLDGRIAWAVLTPEMRRECGNPDDGDGGFVNFLASAEEADVGVLFFDRGNHAVEISFRAKPGIDISQVAFALGGGGHPQAAGCTVQGNIDEVRERVLNMVRHALEGQRARYREAYGTLAD